MWEPKPFFSEKLGAVLHSLCVSSTVTRSSVLTMGVVTSEVGKFEKELDFHVAAAAAAAFPKLGMTINVRIDTAGDGPPYALSNINRITRCLACPRKGRNGRKQEDTDGKK